MTSFDPFNPARGAEPGAVLIGWRPAPVRRRGGRRLYSVRFWSLLDRLLKFPDSMLRKSIASDVPDPLDQVVGDLPHISECVVLHAQQHGENRCKNFYPRDKSFTFVHGVRG